MNEPKSVPEHLLEQLSAGDLPLEEQQKVLEDLKREPGGMERLERLKLSNADILEKYPVHLMSAQIMYRYEQSQAEKRGRSKLWVAIPAIASAACAALIAIALVPSGNPTVPDDLPPIPTDGYTGIKGDPQLIIYKKTQSGAVSLNPSTATAAFGDSLRLEYNAKGASNGMIFSVDGNGAVSLHFPAEETAATELVQGGPQKLGFSYELDDAPDFERFYMVWSETPIDVRAVLDAAMAGAKKEEIDLPDGLEFKTYTLKKRTGDE